MTDILTFLQSKVLTFIERVYVPFESFVYCRIVSVFPEATKKTAS